MNNSLKKLVHQYLDNTYKLDLRVLSEHKVYLKTEAKAVSIAVMYDDVKEMFSLHPYNCGEFFDSWIDSAALRLNNEAVDELYDTYTNARNTPMPPTNAIRLRAIHENNSKGLANRHDYLTPEAIHILND